MSGRIDEIRRRREKKSKWELMDIEEQTRLEKVVLGKGHGLFEAVRDGKPSTHESADEIDGEQQALKIIQAKAAWIDEDDLNIKIPNKMKKFSTGNAEDSYPELLRRQFLRNAENPSWANISKKSGESGFDDDVDEMMRCGKLLAKKSTLPKDTLIISRMEDLNKETRVEGYQINAVEFHPTATVALIAGSSGIASLVQVNGTSNSKLQTIKFRHFPISCAHFSTNGEEFVVGSKSSRSFFYYDMIEGRPVQIPMHHCIGPLNMRKFHMSPDGKFIAICGRFGTIHLLSAKTKEWICDLKMNNQVADISFTCDGRRMYSYNDVGEILEWDMVNRMCTRQMYDDGCIKGLSLSLSNNGQILAAGSSSGIVNLYEMPPKTTGLIPAKIVKNLVTPITELMFNSTSEILAVVSNDKKNALRLVHFPSMTVFSNFPGMQVIGHPRVASFSPSSGFFALGNGNKNVFLYRLKHYQNY